MRHLRALAASLATTFVGVAALSCAGGAPDPKLPPPTSAPVDGAEGAHVDAVGHGSMAVDEPALDRAVSPCDDFYAYACGGWMKATPIPEEEARWMRSFNGIFERNEALLKEILEQAARAPQSDEPYSKELGDFYASCMDEASIEKRTAEDVKRLLAPIEGAKDQKTLSTLLGQLHARGIEPLFKISSEQDFKDATKVIGVVEQGGLGLPDRDYYLKTDDKTKALRDAYEKHVAAMLTLSGEKKPDAERHAKAILAMETELAKASMTKEDRRDPKKVYHRLDRAGLKKTAPKIDWDAYFAALGFDKLDAINVAQPDFFKAASARAAAVAIPGAQRDNWQAYLRYHTIADLAPTLSKPFVEESFRMKQALTGTAKDLPRWKRCVRATDGALGHALARPFVKRTLGAEGKATVLDMIRTIESSMEANLRDIAWMDDATREQALEKLHKIANKIGYPDVWRKYDGIAIRRDSYVDSAISASAFEVKRMLTKIGKPVDRNEWWMTPPTVNAYYDPSMNEMVFPAGILQRPFYDNQMTLAARYGAIGMVMGHELTHGFDDQGRQFDGDGNLKDWWTPSVGDEFTKRASCVKKQFDAYTPIDDLHVNGKLTLGENIADLGGLKLSYKAMKLAIEKSKAEPQKIGDFTPEQQFFLSFAQSWCGNIRPEMARLRLQTDPHSPPKLRVNGPLSNLPEFAEAFSCKPKDKMVREESKRCQVW